MSIIDKLGFHNNNKNLKSDSNLDKSFLPQTKTNSNSIKLKIEEIKNRYGPKSITKIKDISLERSSNTRIIKVVSDENKDILEKGKIFNKIDKLVIKSSNLLKPKLLSTKELIEKLQNNIEIGFEYN